MPAAIHRLRSNLQKSGKCYTATFAKSAELQIISREIDLYPFGDIAFPFRDSHRLGNFTSQMEAAMAGRRVASDLSRTQINGSKNRLRGRPRRIEPYQWLGAGAITLGVGAA